MERPTELTEIRGSQIRGHPRGPDGFVASIYEAHYGEVYGFLVRATRDPSSAEDLLQETFLRLTREVRAGRAPEQVRAWLFRVASNLVISRGRRNATAANWLGRYGAAERDDLIGDSPEASVLRRERTQVIEAALARLPADARVALLLSGQGFGGEEIAAAIGRTHGATRSMLFRARIQVRESLAAEDVS